VKTIKCSLQRIMRIQVEVLKNCAFDRAFDRGAGSANAFAVYRSFVRAPSDFTLVAKRLSSQHFNAD